MNRLWVRLTLAFGLVTLTAVLAAALLANYQVSTDFRRYVMHNQMMSSTLLPALADYYAANNGWGGVDSLLTDFRGAGQGMGMGRGQGQGQGAGQRQGGPPDLLLTDATGQVVGGSGDNRPASLSQTALAEALPVQWQGQTVGYLLAESSPAQTGLTAEAESFLQQINRSLLQAGLMAGLLGLLLGLVIARGLSAPLRHLAEAARRLAQGQLNQRVPEQGAEEIANLAAAFNEMATNLEHAEEKRRNLVADVAHELRTPVSVIQGNLRAILDDVYPLDKEEIASIYDETITLNRLIGDLRDLAQAEAGQLTLTLARTDLTTLIKNMGDLFQELAREHSIDLSLNLDDTLPPVQADEDRLRQVLHNFLSNALRHTPAGGQVVIAAAPEGEQVRVSVRDSGSGIDPENLPHVFERFYRVDKSRSREQGGSGLGLAISRQLIQAHGGQVGADSRPGEGSVFWFTLPADFK